MKRPIGVTMIAVLTLFGAAILALGALVFFFVGVICMTGDDKGQAAYQAIAGMGVAGGFSLLILAGVATYLAIGVLKLREWARIISITAIPVGIGCAIFSIFSFVRHPVIPFVPMVVIKLLIIASGTWMLTYLVRPQVKQAFRPLAAHTVD